ncbi:MAG: BCCT family transporter [Tissierellales bacterium]|nr:BCCT family transporter [Tissierellales bacterium]MBN2827388.1 BCCT family transporter [Tissierellales bacterium]
MSNAIKKESNLPNSKKQSLRKGVFWPSAIVVGGAALLGIINNQLLTKVAMDTFLFSLRTFGWLYQIISVVALIVVGIVTFSKIGNVRFGGENAKPKYSFFTWFAMALTGGIATGVVTYGVNEPIIYLGNIYGELSNTGVTPETTMAAIYSLGRCFYNWTFVPYAMYSFCGLVIAYMYFNKNRSLSISDSLVPLFGEKVTKGVWADLIDTLSLLAIALGLSSSLGAGLALVGSGFQTAYGISQGPVLWLILTLVIAGTFMASAIAGIDKGIKKLSDFNAKVYYILLIIVIISGPTLYIIRMTTAGMAFWLQNFWIWALDPIDIGGEALVMWWTLYDWAIWIAYAPLMGIFLAIISYGRTIRQFMVINWILPSVFSIIWFGVFGATAIYWQQNGIVDLISVINEGGAVSGLWAFLQNMPFGVVFVPVLMITLVLSFSTAADSMTRTIATLCTNNVSYDEEPPMAQKVFWGISIAAIAFFMVAYAGGAQGVDGVKYLAAAGGTTVLFIFVLQVISGIKMFFFDEIVK